MLSLLRKFPEQIKEGIEIGKKIEMGVDGIENIVIAGMGGSGIAGDILKHVAELPFFVNKSYTIPPFVSSSTLFIAISYSGNTEETITAYKKAKKRGARILIITSGGKLGGKKEAILIPPAMQPRAAIAYLLFPIAFFLSKHGLIKKIDFDAAIKAAEMARHRESMAREIADEIEGFPIIYGHGILAAIAKRWRQQFNENAKLHSFSFSLPECNHNEIEAWERDGKEFTCIFLRHSDEEDRINKRIEFMKRIYREKAKIIEIWSEGKDEFSKAVYALHIGDMASVYKAMKDGVEAEPVNLIAKLKEELNQHSRSSS